YQRGAGRGSPRCYTDRWPSRGPYPNAGSAVVPAGDRPTRREKAHAFRAPRLSRRFLAEAARVGLRVRPRVAPASAGTPVGFEETLPSLEAVPVHDARRSPDAWRRTAEGARDTF